MTKKTQAFLFVLPTILIIVIVLIMVNWRLPTLIKLKIPVTRVVFRVGGENRAGVFQTSGITSIVFDEFEGVTLEPKRLIALSKRIKANKPVTAKRVMRLGPNASTVAISPKEERYHPNVTITASKGERVGVLTLSGVSAAPGTQITLETTEDPGDIVMRVDGEQTNGSLVTGNAVRLELNHCLLKGVSNFQPDEQSILLESELRQDTFINFVGRPKSLMLAISVPEDRQKEFFARQSIPITGVMFERQNDDGTIVSSVTGQAELTYPDHEGKKVALDNSGYIALQGLERFTIDEISMDPGGSSFSLTLQGIANNIKTGSATFQNDRRLSVYDAVSSNHLLVLVAVLGWILPTSIALYESLKGRHK
jgi:hypothetical protein